MARVEKEQDVVIEQTRRDAIPGRVLVKANMNHDVASVSDLRRKQLDTKWRCE
jgi:hypothetical protein